MKIWYLVRVTVHPNVFNKTKEPGTANAVLKDEIQSNLESLDRQIGIRSVHVDELQNFSLEWIVSLWLHLTGDFERLKTQIFKQR